MPRAGDPKWRLFPYGAFGALLPAIVSIAGKTDWFTFAANVQWVAAGVIYVVAAALLSTIFPYSRRATPFNATLIGVLFPTIVGGAASVAMRTLPPGILDVTKGGVAQDSSIWIEWLYSFSLI